MRELSTYEVEQIAEALSLIRPSEGILTTAEHNRLLTDFRQELSRRERAASERNIAPSARAQQYNRAGAIVTVFETPMAAGGVKAPKAAGESRLIISDIDQLLMLVGDPEALVPDA